MSSGGCGGGGNQVKGRRFKRRHARSSGSRGNPTALCSFGRKHNHNIGVHGTQATVQGHEPAFEVARQACQVGIRHLPVPDHTAPGDLGVAHRIGPEAVTRMRGEVVEHPERCTGVELAARSPPPSSSSLVVEGAHILAGHHARKAHPRQARVRVDRRRGGSRLKPTEPPP